MAEICPIRAANAFQEKAQTLSTNVSRNVKEPTDFRQNTLSQRRMFCRWLNKIEYLSGNFPDFHKAFTNT
jgi:hypothetical protein